MKQQSLASMFGGAPKKKEEPTPKAGPVKSKPQSTKSDPPTSKSDVDVVQPPDDVKKLITWKKNQPVPFKFLADILEVVEGENSRNTNISDISAYLLAVLCSTPTDIIPFSFIWLGTLRPASEGVTINVGPSLIQKAITVATGQDPEEQMTREGDLGTIAASSRSKQQTIGSMFGVTEKPLTVQGVYDTFLKIALKGGQGTQHERVGQMVQLLARAKDNEAKYIIRGLEGKVRVGAGDHVYLAALGQAFLRRDFILQQKKKEPTPEQLDEGGKRFKQLYLRRPVLDDLIRTFLAGGFQAGEEFCQLKPGQNLSPMLAKPAKSLENAAKTLGEEAELTFEYKYDGERGQIHKTADGNITIFSRSGNESTQMFQEVLGIIKANVDCNDCIIDSEIVAIEPSTGAILPFQKLIARSKKGDDIGHDKECDVCIFAFDLLYLNGTPLDDVPFKIRREQLLQVMKPVQNHFQFATHLDTTLEVENIKDFFLEAVKNKTEGLMVKDLNSPYRIGKRSSSWVKLKKDYLADFGTGADGGINVSDTIDMVPIGATLGKGKRTGKFGSYSVAVYNPNNHKWEAMTQLGTGLSDQDLDDLATQLQEYKIDVPDPRVDYGKNIPDVYFQPHYVWELKMADIQLSQQYNAGADLLFDEERRQYNGFSLRFTRFLRVRDKAPDDCTTTEQIVDMYRAAV